ncbi:MAG: CRISPR-associated protein Cas4 [Flavobacteriales bacterium]|nr:CRISPR-associated protein Cas4 [Flavobacteriales bacterium]
MYTDDELLMISGIQHFAFCPRQWALIHIEQQWNENSLTLEGDYLHTRVDNPECMVSMRGVFTIRAVPLVSYDLGMYGISDAIELHKTEDKENAVYQPKYRGFYTPYPVEYKHGTAKMSDEDRLQVCLQVMCLEEMYGITLEKGAIYYASTRNREEITIDLSLRSKVIDSCKCMHHLFSTKSTPSAVYNAKCNSCSLKDLCMPKMKNNFNSVKTYLKELKDDA